MPSKHDVGSPGIFAACVLAALTAGLPSPSAGNEAPFPRHSVRVARQANRLVCWFDFPAPTLTSEQGLTAVSMAGLEPWTPLGRPVLPVYDARILVPAGTTVGAVTVRPADLRWLPGRHVLPHGQSPQPLSAARPAPPTPRDERLYASDDPFPAVAGQRTSLQFKHGRGILFVRLHPVRYRPRSGRLGWTSRVELEIALADAGPAPVRRVTRRTSDAHDIRRLADNPETPTPGTLGSETPSGALPGGPLGPSLLAPGDFDYVAIAPSAFLATPPPWNLEALCALRASRGLASTNVPIEWICAQYSGTRPDGGTDDATRIRNFIADAYATWGTRYALLVGDSAHLPLRQFWVESGTYPNEVTTMPSDLYYGCLDGTFDASADGVYGEPGDGPDGGEVDLAAEVYVGRIAVANAEEVARAVRKIIEYEDAPGPWLPRVCMLGEYLGFGGVSDYARPSLEQIRKGGSYDGYATTGFRNSLYSNAFDTSVNLYDDQATWSGDTLIALLNSGVNAVDHLGHANTYYNMKLSVPAMAQLTNVNPFFVYSQGCYAGQLDAQDCFAESLTTLDKGAVAAIMNARYGWGAGNSTDGSSHRFNRRFWDAALGHDLLPLGVMNQYSKEQWIGAIDDACMRWCYYELNLFGDPAMPFARQLVGGPPVIEHTPLENTAQTNAPRTLTARLTPGDVVDTNTLWVFWNTDGSTNAAAGDRLTHVGRSVYDAEIAAYPLGTPVHYWLQGSALNGRQARDPTNAPAATHRFDVAPAVRLAVTGTPETCGAVVPAYGELLLASGVWVRASAPLHTDPTNDHRFACAGWTGSGSAPLSGPSNAVSFVIREPSELTWQWQRQHPLWQTSSVAGLMDTTTWWNASATGATITAEGTIARAGTNFCFAGWSIAGARLPDSTNAAVNPAPGIVMSTARVAVAAYLPAQTDADGDGLADWWEWLWFGSTNENPDSDADGDGFDLAMEFADRTDPHSPTSAPTPPVLTHTALADPQPTPAPYPVTAGVTDNYLVQHVTLYWKRNDGAMAETNLSLAAPPSTYAAAIPAPGTNGDRFEYSLRAWDMAGLVTSNGPHAFTAAYPVPAFAPTSLVDAVLAPETNAERFVTLTNHGNASLDWELTLLPAGLVEDFEVPTNVWSHGGGNDLWNLAGRRAHSGTQAWYCGMSSTGLYMSSMHAKLDTPPVMLGPGAQMIFWHWLRCELNGVDHAWDGGIVEISTNGGASFQQIAPVGGYPYRISGWRQSPWVDGTPCFAGSGSGWQSVVFDLSAFAGRAVIVRFHFGTDSNTEFEGWYVDDVAMLPWAGTNAWLALEGTNAVTAPGSGDVVQVSLSSAGMPTGDRSAVLRFRSNAPGAGTNDLPVLMRVRSPPALGPLVARQTSTNGEGWVTLSNAVADADADTCEMAVRFSLDAGTTWTNAWIRSASGSCGTPAVSNAAPRQVGGILTATGGLPETNRLTLVWSTTNEPSVNGVSMGALLTVRAWDGLFWGPAVTSQPFIVDNEPPGPPGAPVCAPHTPGVWATNATLTLVWSPAGDGSGGGVADYRFGAVTGGVPAVLPLSATGLAGQLTLPFDGSNWWMLVRARDVYGNTGPAAQSGPYWVDTRPPSASGAVVLLEHSPYGAYGVDTGALTGRWAGFVDALSGVEGYYCALQDGHGTTGGAWTLSTTGALAGLAADQTNAFFVWARDRAGLIGDAAQAALLVLSGTGDWDHDGLSNAGEELAGTDARSAASVLAVRTGPGGQPSPTGTVIILEWPGASNRLYAVEWSDEIGFAVPVWQPLPDCTNLPGIEGTMVCTDRQVTAERRFYRISVRPAGP
jgi:hypothetical protein